MTHDKKDWECAWSLAGMWLVYLGEDQHRVCLPREREADARLIAAAPKLLKGLIHANAWSRTHDDDEGLYADLIALATEITKPQKEKA